MQRMGALTAVASAIELQERLVAFTRAFGLHQPDQTPCGEPVPVSEAHALIELARVEALGQVELGRRLQLEKSSVSRLVAQLIRRAWVERLADQRDGRVSLLRLTPGGQQAAMQLAQARAAKVARLLNDIPEHERDAVLHALDVLTEALHDNYA